MQTVKQPHFLTVAEYIQLDIPARTELLGGLIYDVSPKKEPHILAVAQINKALTRGLGDEYLVRIQDPIAVAGWTGTYDPEIDVAVVAGKPYPARATAKDAFSFVEVSDTTYKEDREEYVPLYVAAGVRTWHVNIRARQVEFHDIGAEANGPPTRIFREGETFETLDVPIRVANLFAPR